MFIEINLVSILMVILVILLVICGYRYYSLKKQVDDEQENLQIKKLNVGEHMEPKPSPADEIFSNPDNFDTEITTKMSLGDEIFESHEQYFQESINRPDVPLLQGSQGLIMDAEDYPSNPRVGIPWPWRNTPVQTNDNDAQVLDVNTRSIYGTKNTF